MKDIYEAVEKLSAVLAFSVERVASNKGWAAKPYSLMIAPTPDRLVMVVSTTVLLPGAMSACFTPRYEPQTGGRTWGIDVRRTDGVARETWSDGLTISRNEGRFVIMHGAIALSNESLDLLLEDLGTP